MKVLLPGHLYSLENFDNKFVDQKIQFIQKAPSKDDPTKLVVVSDGTTNEELLAVLINRTKYLNEQFPCRENSIAITKMEEALMWFEKRTRDRVQRGVEGTHQK